MTEQDEGDGLGGVRVVMGVGGVALCVQWFVAGFTAGMFTTTGIILVVCLRG